jgi:hypothetical protein
MPLCRGYFRVSSICLARLIFSMRDYISAGQIDLQKLGSARLCCRMSTAMGSGASSYRKRFFSTSAGLLASVGRWAMRGAAVYYE